ncbi:sensor domain-containing protein [Streptomyces tubbatahanensis]|uniref:histidine kinase n=1 Tax=Streptomyces tubbatahanensis TaxID=2923272 RepID=A0ABY3XZB6_9ACTN|nr:sensor histidine kinase [Streptomyces tubbatahanensis]UNS99613.1 sensor domain-containing protein [Streptomyces tubbatahanensis]
MVSGRAAGEARSGSGAAKGAGGGVWQALGAGPRAFLCSAWPLRALGYLLAGGVLGVGWFFLALALAVAGVLLLPVGVGAVALACVPVSAAGLAALERRRLRWLQPGAVPSPHESGDAEGAEPHGGPVRRVLRRLRRRTAAPATWIEFGFALPHAVLSLVDLFVVVAGIGLVVSQPLALLLVGNGEQVMYGEHVVLTEPGQVVPWLLLTPVFAVFVSYVWAGLAGVRAALARAVLVGPRRERELDARLTEVTASRARLADAFALERRRIERDLHDGAQQRLTGLIMTLGLAKLDADPALVADAQDEARAVLAELRELVHGMHPSVLTDRGLGAAIEALAERSPVPVEVDVRPGAGRPEDAVEAAAYFAVAEALANVAKHSGASRATVTVRAGSALVVEVHDDGRGGADPRHGTGLTGLADRLAVHEGRLSLSSPAGGPTLLRMELPCRPGRAEEGHEATGNKRCG